MITTRSITRSVVASLTAVLAASACSGSDGASTATTIEFVPADAPAAEAQTPFCAGMSEISLRVNTDPPDDLNSYLISAYEALAPDVPAGIVSEFQSVLAGLRGASATTATSVVGTLGDLAGTTVAGFAEEGYLPDPEPELRLNAYLADNCFGTQSNPGPPPTQPLSEIPTDPTNP